MLIALSVLDVTPVPSGSSAGDALRASIDLARHVETLGFARYWLAEHHNAGSIAGSAPEIMIAEIANATSRIRVGSGGIMLPNHSPLKVAETFRVLGALHPDRVDLGLGRAAGADPKTALALRETRELLGSERFPEQLDALLGFLSGDPDPEVRFGAMKAVPTGVPSPPVFLLGSGLESAELAARLGLGFAFAQHIAPDGDAYARSLRAYRASFRPSAWLATPRGILAVSVLCAGSEEAAADLVRCADVSFLRFGQGLRDLPFPSVEEARAYRFDADEEIFRVAGRARQIAGVGEHVGAVLRQMVEASGADEVMMMTNIHDHAERKRSYERVAKALH